ncbi:anti-sigma regulatory factor (Ser/Thr protein kinase) [Saccharothrix carnea]|uniref:Anti-sigma regulatory factor (Ser/Thr protein kinase) n=1 Tax=Saccharothrix carnea TaxID=1280637 RepID=A0A2P8I3R3_SACCR|nr:ATP-binding protein [Saccharothrix carnea]PSL53103.1 anti-sigma regulatory factor (Ser/Thr protein kinase) [Saccharothrix carnea]
MTDQLADHHWGAEFPAQPGQLSAVRARLDAWLAAEGLSEDDRYDLLVAVNEAASNAIEHAYGPGEHGLVHIDAHARPDGSVRVVVADRGGWRVPPPTLTARGRGLLLMRENVDEVLVDRGAGGTTVTLVLAPRHGSRDSYPAAPQPPDPVDVTARDGWVEVVVRGDVPAQAAPAVRRRILTAARGGTVPVVVDLRALGERNDGLIRSLRAVAEAAAAAGTRVVVRAPEQGHARRALVAAGVDQVVDLVPHV